MEDGDRFNVLVGKMTTGISFHHVGNALQVSAQSSSFPRFKSVNENVAAHIV